MTACDRRLQFMTDIAKLLSRDHF